MSEAFPVAQAVLDSRFRIKEVNDEFCALLRIKKKPAGAFPDLFGERRESVRKYLVLSNAAGLYLEYTGPDHHAQQFRILSRRAEVRKVRRPAGGKPGARDVIYYVIIQDFTNFQESVAYFEQSFDQFMEATIDLEQALKTIAVQKGEIEAINHELRQTNAIMRKDLELAEILQKDLMPAEPSPPGWTIGAYLQPMAGVSGDILDYFDFPGSGCIGVVLLDASGHGVSSALITAIARPIFFRAHREYMNQDLRTAVQSANRMLCDQIGHISNYLSGVSVRLYTDRIAYINAGHPYILLYRRRTGRTYRLPNSPVLLGINEFREREMKVREIRIESGDTMLLYTDGLTEARDAAGVEYGTRRLGAVVRNAAGSKNAREVRDRILEDFRAFAADPAHLKDDMTFVVCRAE